MAALEFARATGLACPAGCGDCCVNDEPEDSVLAALPAARWAVANGLAERLSGAAQSAPYGPCVFYNAERAQHCTVYPLRPLLCRLFGFAGRRDKQGAAQYRPCRRMNAGAGAVSAAPPLFGEQASRLESIHPALGGRRLPMNLAFAEAAAWLLLRSQYATDGPDDRTPPAPKPTRPRPRAA